MFTIDSKDFRIKSAARITVRDYSDYDSNLCHDGGHYAVGVTFIRHPDGWERQEYTSGDYCPYCGSFDCCGSCEEAEAAESERLTDAEVMDEVDHYRGRLTRQSCTSLHDGCPLRRAFCVGGKMENRQPLRDPGYSLADRRKEEEALRTAVDMLAPEHRPLCAFPLGDAPEVRMEYPHHHWLYTDDRPEPQMLDALGRLCGMLGYHFRPVIYFILGERGAEMLRHSTGVDAKALGRLLTVICAKEREQIWRREEEK